MEFTLAGIVGLCILAFQIGRVFEKWSSGTMDIEEEAYKAGYEVGHREGLSE